MGQGGSHHARVSESVSVEHLPKYIDERLQEKYDRGMRAVMQSLASSLGIFVALQEIAVEMNEQMMDLTELQNGAK